MNKADHLEKSREGQRKTFRHARDYGKLVHVGTMLSCEQVEALRALPYAPITEHLRRAVDLYLSQQK